MSGLTAVTVGAGVSAPEGAASTRASEPRIRNRTVERRVARRAPTKRRPYDRRWSTPRSPVFPNPMPRTNFSLEPPPRTFRYAGSPLPRRAAEGNRDRIGASGRERKIAKECQGGHRFHMCPVGSRDLVSRRDTGVGPFPNWRAVDPWFAGSARESRRRDGPGGVQQRAQARPIRSSFGLTSAGGIRAAVRCAHLRPSAHRVARFVAPRQRSDAPGHALVARAPAGQEKAQPPGRPAWSRGAGERSVGCPSTRAELTQLTAQ